MARLLCPRLGFRLAGSTALPAIARMRFPIHWTECSAGLRPRPPSCGSIDYAGASKPLCTLLVEGLGQRTRRICRLRRSEIQEIDLRRPESVPGKKLLPWRVGLRRAEYGDRLIPIGHDDPLSGSDAARVAPQIPPKLMNSDPLHSSPMYRAFPRTLAGCARAYATPGVGPSSCEQLAVLRAPPSQAPQQGGGRLGGWL